jgi:hypothetical protein
MQIASRRTIATKKSFDKTGKEPSPTQSILWLTSVYQCHAALALIMNSLGEAQPAGATFSINKETGRCVWPVSLFTHLGLSDQLKPLGQCIQTR